MPNEKQPSTDEMNLSALEKLPDLVWEQITQYLDLPSKHQVRLSSKTNKNHIENHYSSIHFKKQAEFCQFTQNPPSFYYIKNLQLSADVTNFIFPYPRDPSASQFSFFSGIEIQFPRIENIYLELGHLYILLILTNDPKFSTHYTLIKELTVIPLQVSLLTKQGLKKIKYGDAQLSDIEIENYYNNYLTRETMNVFKKFTSLQHLGISLYDGVVCDYEDLGQLLEALPLLKILDLEIPFELIYEPEETEFPDKTLKNYPVKESALKSYPNIKTLRLKGRYWSASLLTHFPYLIELALDYSHNDSEPTNGTFNKINQLLAELRYPEKLLSLEILASVPFKMDATHFIFKLINSNLAQLTQFTQLKKLTINPPKNFYTVYIDSPQKKFYHIQESPALFSNRNFILPSIKKLEIHYTPSNSYHQGDFSAMRLVFPNLNSLRITLEKQTWTQEFNELCKVLKENPWSNIQINIHGIAFPHVLHSLFPNAEFTENRFTLRISTYKTEQARENSKKTKFESRKTLANKFFQANLAVCDLGEKALLKRKTI